MQTRHKILIAIRRFHAQHEFGPSLDQIAEEVGLNHRSSVHFHIKKLVAEGLVLADPGMSRSWRLSDAGQLLVKETP